MPDSAIATFERFLSTPFWQRNQLRRRPDKSRRPYKRLGELYEAKGDKQKAASYYTKFVELWKNADPELQPRSRRSSASSRDWATRKRSADPRSRAGDLFRLRDGEGGHKRRLLTALEKGACGLRL